MISPDTHKPSSQRSYQIVQVLGLSETRPKPTPYGRKIQSWALPWRLVGWRCSTKDHLPMHSTRSLILVTAPAVLAKCQMASMVPDPTGGPTQTCCGS